MLFQTYGDRRNPAVLFFHAMGVTGASSEPIARYLQDRYFCILPTSTVYCEGQKYVSKLDEIRQVEDFLHRQGVERLAMVVASSIGADLAMAFLTQTKLLVEHAFFDGGQFAQIGKGTRRIMTPFLYFAIKSLYWAKGGTLKKILWCDDDSIKSYFIDAGKNLTYTNLRRQISDSLEDKPFPPLSKELQKHTYFEFGSIEDHFKYRQAVIEAYHCGNYPVFEGNDHMQYQIRDPKGFAEMLAFIAEQDGMPKLPFIRK
jgi:pimeloyl-ACP methyl ester carboxylesterase